GRVAALLSALDRVPMGWDEILHPGLAGDWLVQCWRHASHRDRALGAGYDCVYSAGYYLDLNLPAGWHYRVDPEAPRQALEALDREMWSLPGLAGFKDALGSLAGAQSEGEALPERDAKGRVLGGEACMWTELVTDELLDRRVFSRLPAVAERLWSPREITDEDSMYARLPGLWTFLARTTPVDLESSGMRLFSRLGDAKSLRDFADLLEPVKWYRRHIGDEAIRARAQRRRVADRPYDVLTPLNRLVDILMPESLEGRRLSELVSKYVSAPDDSLEAQLREHADSWRRIAAQLRTVDPAALREVMALVEALPRLADLLDAGLDRKDSALENAPDLLAGASKAAGECTLAIVAPLTILLGRQP
ncbi:MAG: family 20 glycosylhydrolase, partial [Pseudomonadales bacterium]